MIQCETLTEAKIPAASCQILLSKNLFPFSVYVPLIFIGNNTRCSQVKLHIRAASFARTNVSYNRLRSQVGLRNSLII